MGDYLDKGWLSKQQLGIALDTRGYLRYKAIKENYKTENNNIICNILYRGNIWNIKRRSEYSFRRIIAQ